MIFLFPTELEAQKFRAACPHATIVICGVGAAECAASTAKVISEMRSSATEQMLVLAGVAGSYSLDDVAMCEVVEVVHEEISALPERFRTTYSFDKQTTLRAVSSNSVNGAWEQQTSCQIENMEGAAFMALCNTFNLRAIEIRAISNRVGDPFVEWKLSEACDALKEVLVNLSDTLC